MPDPSRDGKVRLDELCVVVGGTLDFTLEAYYRVGPFRDEFPFTRATLHNFDNQPNCGVVQLARNDGGQLRLFVGRDAQSRDPRFDGWFDPVVRLAVLRRIPPFAVGSQVVLNGAKLAKCDFTEAFLGVTREDKDTVLV